MSASDRLISLGKDARSQATMRPMFAWASAAGILWRWSSAQYWPTMYTAAASQYSSCAGSTTCMPGAWKVKGTPWTLSEAGSGVGVGGSPGSEGMGVGDG